MRIWRVGIEDYQGRLNQPAMPDDLAPLRRLLLHLLATDPDRFWVAERGDGTTGRPARRVRERLAARGPVVPRDAVRATRRCRRTGSGRR